MRRHIVYTLGLALALPCAGAWAADAPANPDAPVAPNQAQPAPSGSSVSSEAGTTATPTYYSPLQEFASKNVDEVGELSRQMTLFRAANRPDAVMALYHMIRDHRLAADAAGNMLARRGDVSTPTITVMPPMSSNPADLLQMDIQQHQQMASDLQQMVSNANQAGDKNLYQKALDVTNKHVQWLQSLNQGQQASLGFFGPTTPLGELSGTTAIAAASGYPQPAVTERTAAFRQQVAPRRTVRQPRYRRARYSRRGRYTRRSRYHRMSGYRY